MKYALIGCGRISPNHIEAAKNNHLEFVAMCDIVPEVMQEKSDRFGLEAVHKYIDYKELLEKEKPELVAIATESGKHAAIALDCIAAGCHVIIEKPIALSIADADAIIKAGKRLALLYALTIRIALISQCSICERLWKRGDLAGFPMVPLMSDGTVGKATTIKHRGEGHGRRMAAA